VLVHGYHGFHDWYQASLPERAGIPAALRATVEPFAWDDLDALAARFAAVGDTIAAVVMEPASHELPPPGWLEGIRALCTRHGALLVFDEVVTALRLAHGGAQEAFGVRADLVCLGKSLANGMPLSALCGPAAILRDITRVGYGLTFRGETLSLAAAHATLDVLARERGHEHLAAIGARLQDGFAARAANAGVDAALRGFPARTSLEFAGRGRLTPLGLQTLFIHSCLGEGVLTNGSFLPSLAHGEEEVARTLAAFDVGLAAVARACSADSYDGVAHFRPGPACFLPEHGAPAPAD